MKAGAFITGGLLLIFLVILLKLFLVKWGWSLFMVPVFDMRAIGWWEALGLVLLLPSSVNYNSNK